MSAPIPSSRPRLAALDGLRFFAALAVLSYHYLGMEREYFGAPPSEVFPTAHRFAGLGAYGVDLFFVISGFVIFMTAYRRPLRDFIASRIARLYPAYVVAVALCALLLGFLFTDVKDVKLANVALNFTMFQEGFGEQNLDGVYWTLWSELRFYILIGILMAVGGLTRTRALAFAGLWPLLAGVAATTDSSLVRTILLTGQAPWFAAGMALFILTLDRRSLLAWLVLAENALLCMSPYAIGGFSDVIHRNAGVEVRQTGQVAVVVLCIGLPALAALTPLRHVSWKPLTTAGLLTYPLYLTHEYWGWWLISELHDSLPPLATLAITICFALALAYALNRFVERPLGPLVRRAIRGDLARTEPGSDAPPPSPPPAGGALGVSGR
ncbi:MAG: acyltransferase [Bifidobacteriaceae bacterium]|nr:acyltransferase [Bifidobacteriaceae bacterium]